jgi:sporulation protein YlmC with PRC-barrel domain
MLKLLASLLLSAAAFTAQATPVSANALLDAPVLDTQGKRLGILRDLAVDVENESVAYAIVDYRDPAVPSVDLRPVALTDLRPALAPGSLVLDSSAGGGGSAVPQDDARLRRASTLLGMKIEHPSGADYGVIEDIVVELDSARVQRAVVRLDAGAPATERDVPFAVLRFPAGSASALLTLQQGLVEVTGEVTQRARRPRRPRRRGDHRGGRAGHGQRSTDERRGRACGIRPLRVPASRWTRAAESPTSAPSAFPSASAR